MTLGAETNAIYQDLIDQALAMEIDMLRDGVPLEDARLARTFGGEAAIVLELRRLQRLNADARHFELGAYHNALLHAIVSDFIESLADRPDKLTFCNERYVVGRIDLGAFMETFFLDEDFTWPADLVNHLTRPGSTSPISTTTTCSGSRTSWCRPPRNSGSPRQGIEPRCARSSR